MKSEFTKPRFSNTQSVIIAILGLVFVASAFATVSWCLQAKEAHGYEMFWQFGSFLAAIMAASCAVALAGLFRNGRLNHGFVVATHLLAIIPIAYILFCVYLAIPEIIKLLK